MGNWLQKALGINSLKMDFNYDPAHANVPGMNFGNIANQMLTGQGSYFDAQRQAGSQQIADASANQLQQQNAMLASRGLGGGGLRSLMDATSATQVGEQTSKFNLGLQQQGFQQAGTFANLGLQQAMANQQAENEATQYAKTSAYNQAAANRAARGQFFGNVMSLASGPLTAYAKGQFPDVFGAKKD
tara:strand:- start:197 stop:757 length:561 start_codon:yes stop_codon:yes gene_type:complete